MPLSRAVCGKVKALVNTRRTEGLQQVGGAMQTGEEEFTALQLSFIRETPAGIYAGCGSQGGYFHRTSFRNSRAIFEERSRMYKEKEKLPILVASFCQHIYGQPLVKACLLPERCIVSFQPTC